MAYLLPEPVFINEQERLDGSYLRIDGGKMFLGGMGEIFISQWDDVSDRAKRKERPIVHQYMKQIPDKYKEAWNKLMYETLAYMYPGGTMVVDTESVAIDKTELSLKAGKSVSLTATVSPDNSYLKDVEWSSSDETIATVKDGKISAISAGETTITVKTVDRGHMTSCKIIVTGSN
jgi:uncharacterized protein YjdB